jgi:uncharacterized DUF497 family protein
MGSDLPGASAARAFHAAAMLLRRGIGPQPHWPPCFTALDNRFIWGYNQIRMYDWDETKRAKNLANHGVDFALIEAFDWEHAIIEKDERRDYPEERYRALGYVGDRLHAAVFTIRLGNIRLISLRKANKREVLKWLAK